MAGHTGWHAQSIPPFYLLQIKDLPFVQNQPPPKLGGLFGGDFHALFADGSVRFISKHEEEAKLRLLIQRDDGRPIGELVEPTDELFFE